MYIVCTLRICFRIRLPCSWKYDASVIPWSFRRCNWFRRVMIGESDCDSVELILNPNLPSNVRMHIPRHTQLLAVSLIT